MSKFKIINIIDYIFISFATFILCFAIIQFLIGNFFLSLFISVVLCFSILLTIKILISKKHSAKLAIENNILKAELFAYNFQALSQSKKIKIVYDLLEKEYNARIVGNHIEYTFKNEKAFILVENNIEIMSKITLINIIKPYLNRIKKIIIICDRYNDVVSAFINTISNFNIQIIDRNDFFQICQSKDIQLKETFKIIIKRIQFKDILKNFFSSSHAKGFFISGLVILFTSFIIPYKIYYFIVGIILIIFSIICKLPKFKPTMENWLEK